MTRVSASVTVAALLVCAAGETVASDRDEHHNGTSNQASELVPWCRSEAEARYIAKNIRRTNGPRPTMTTAMFCTWMGSVGSTAMTSLSGVASLAMCGRIMQS